MIEPRIIPVRGRFMAVSPDRVRPRIAVTADTEAEARADFLASFEQWQSLIAEARALRAVTPESEEG